MSDERFERIRSLGGERYRAFLDAGYREYWQGGGFNWHITPYLLQKRIDSGRDKLFFIDVWVYEPREGVRPVVGWQPEAQFYLANDGDTFNVTLLADEPTPNGLLIFFRAIYFRMECRPYEAAYKE